MGRESTSFAEDQGQVRPNKVFNKVSRSNHSLNEKGLVRREGGERHAVYSGYALIGMYVLPALYKLSGPRAHIAMALGFGTITITVELGRYETSVIQEIATFNPARVGMSRDQYT